MSFKNYYKQLNSQTGIKAYIKKKLFNNLLKELVKQENMIEKQNETIKAQGIALKKQERIIKTVIRRIEETVLSREKPGVLIDVSQVTAHGVWVTGIQKPGDKRWLTGITRVVNNIFHHIYNQSENVIPIQYKEGRLITSYLYLSRLEGLEERTEQTIAFQRGDKLLLLDDPWFESDAYSHILDQIVGAGGKSYAIVHDLIPVQYPQVCGEEKVIKEYTDWHHMIMQKADAIVCVSRTTADALAEYYGQMQFTRTRPLSVYYFHLGADVPVGTEIVREEIRQFAENGRFTFLMVGTVEPRKGHMVALQALQKLPDTIRKDCCLLVIGKNGWKNEDVRKMLASPELKDCVLWIRDASDGELRWAYSHTDALIAASLQEGFGLPLVEAAQFGLPLICSDIPVFREVTQGNADYFTVMNPDALAECLIKWMQTEQHPDSRNIRIYSWQESAREFLDIMEGKVEPYKVLR